MNQGSTVFRFPPDPDSLHNWLRDHLKITVPRAPVMPGHAAPFAYLEHVFFEAGALRDPPAPDLDPLDAVVWANRGGGKTYLGALATMLDLVFKPGVEVRILGGSLDQSARMLAHLRSLFRAEPLADLVEGRITERRIRLSNGSQAEILAQSETSVCGTRVQKLRCDEAELFDHEVWEAAQLTTRSAEVTLSDGRRVEVKGSIECLSTMHRPYGLMHRVVAEARDGVRSLFRWGVVDVLEHCGEDRHCPECALQPECEGKAKHNGCGGHISIDDAVRMKSRVSLATWESEMLCLRPRRSDSVYPEFSSGRHVVGDGPDWLAPAGTLLAGMDFGFRAPTVVLWAVLDGAGVLWVLAERERTETLVREHARALLDGPGVDGLGGPPAWVGVDPAGEQRSDQTGVGSAGVLRKAGLVVRNRRMELRDGISLVRARLAPAAGSPRLLIHARCTHLIECLERYHYPAEHPESTTPEKDGSDHAPDALRYLIQNLDARFETRCAWYR